MREEQTGIHEYAREWIRLSRHIPSLFVAGRAVNMGDDGNYSFRVAVVCLVVVNTGLIGPKGILRWLLSGNES